MISSTRQIIAATDRNSTEPHIITMFTYNLACLPQIYGIQLNSLAPNLQRAVLLAHHIMEKNYGIVALQEVWDTVVVEYLVHVLDRLYESSRSGLGHKQYLILHGGVLFFSKYKIVGFWGESFPAPMFGEEWIGQKGPQMVKIQINNKFLTIVNVHFHSDSMFPEKILQLLSFLFGLGSAGDAVRRDKQMQMLSDKMKTWAKTPPEGSRLEYAGTVLLGDLNTPLDKLEEILQLEAANGFRRTGQHDLFSQIEFNLPKNYHPSSKGDKKTGETFAGTWKAKAGDQPSQLFDGAFATKDSAFKLSTNIVWIKDKKGRDVSDHAGIAIECKPK